MKQSGPESTGLTPNTEGEEKVRVSYVFSSTPERIYV